MSNRNKAHRIENTARPVLALRRAELAHWTPGVSPAHTDAGCSLAAEALPRSSSQDKEDKNAVANSTPGPQNSATLAVAAAMQSSDNTADGWFAAYVHDNENKSKHI